MLIRKAKSNDARRISYLIRKNTEKVKENNYSADQVYAWKKANSESEIRKKINERAIFCAFENQKLVGTIGLHESEIVGLYVGYTKIGKGIGKKLLEYLENFARKKNIRQLKLTSTPAALSFYQRNGYSTHGIVNVEVNGVNFPETRMLKNLT